MKDLGTPMCYCVCVCVCVCEFQSEIQFIDCMDGGTKVTDETTPRKNARKRRWRRPISFVCSGKVD